VLLAAQGSLQELAELLDLAAEGLDGGLGLGLDGAHHAVNHLPFLLG
jgi:hypothetical protein